MGYRYIVLGAGRQGTAAAFDLARHGEADEVVFLDRDPGVARAAAGRVNALLGSLLAHAVGEPVDASDAAVLTPRLRGGHGVFSALPYRFNPYAARAAIEAGAHFCDLGGNTAIVREVLALDGAARSRGVSVVPDCGLAPGVANVIAALAIDRVPGAQHVHIRCGGLPQHPKPPLGYKLVFDIAGLTNEYTGEAECLRDGRRVSLPTLEEVEALEFPDPVGRCEAFLTSGGTSTCCETWEGKLLTYEYKTVRYPGHCERMRVLLDLGLFDLTPVTLPDGRRVVPREVFHACAMPRLLDPGDRDLVVLRVRCSGATPSQRVSFDVLDFHDETTGFTAMERCTAFPAAATLHLQVKGAVASGAGPPERVVPPQALLDGVRARGIDVRESR